MVVPDQRWDAGIAIRRNARSRAAELAAAPTAFQPGVDPGRRRHLVRLGHARPVVRVVPGQVPAVVQIQLGSRGGQGRQVEPPGQLQPGITGGEDVQACPGTVAGQPAEQLRGPVGDVGREACEDQHVVRNHRPGGGPVVGLHRVVHVGQPGLGDVHDVLGQPGQEDLDLRRAGRDPAAYPQRGRQPQERAQVVALPGGIGECQPHHARHGGHREAESQRLQQGTRPVRTAALGDQKMAVPGQARHRGQRRQAFPAARPQHADTQPIRQRSVQGRLVGIPGPVAEAAQSPRMPGRQRRHGAEEVSGGPARASLVRLSARLGIPWSGGAEAVQVMLMVVSHHRGRLRQADAGVPDLLSGRLDRHAVLLWPVPLAATLWPLRAITGQHAGGCLHQR